MFSFNFRIFLQSFLSFLKNLLVTHWRSLLVLLSGILLPLLVFEELAVEVSKHQGGFQWDVQILQAIHQTSQPQLDVFAAALTKLGGFGVVFVIACAIALILLLRGQWSALAYLLTTVVGSRLINLTAKGLLHRVRPHLWESPAPEFDFAFPSGHSMGSMTLVAALVILTWGSSWCWVVLVVGSLLVFAIAWTRLYLGVHFPSDILAGWMVSIPWAIGVSLLIKPRLPKSSVVNNEVLADQMSTDALANEPKLLITNQAIKQGTPKK